MLRAGAFAICCWFAIGWVSTVSAQAAEPIGFVLMASGEVLAVDRAQVSRSLKRKSPFFAGESLRTGSDSQAQLRFTDGSLIAMRADSEIRFDRYRFTDDKKLGDTNIFTLVSGGFRTITGKIGKKNPESYQMKSSVASIGVRGTTYEAVIGRELVVAAWQGQVVVKNESGSLVLGEQAAYNYAVVSGPHRAPKGQTTPPAAVQQGVAGDTEDMGDGDDQGGGDDGQSEEESAATAEDDGGDSQAEAGTDEGDSGVALIEGGGTAALVSVTQVVPPLVEVGNENALPPETNEVYVATDVRLDGVVLDRVGIAYLPGWPLDGGLLGGRAGIAGNSLVVTDNGLDPSQVGFDTVEPLYVVKQGSAPVRAGSVSQFVLDASHTVNWGIWDASATNPVYVYSDRFDLSQRTAITKPVYWADFSLAPATAVSARSGQLQYRHVLGFMGEGSAGGITDLYLNLGINFDTAQINGALHVYAGDVWHVSLGGRVLGVQPEMAVLGGKVNGLPGVIGNLGSVFTGGNGQAILSTFSLAQNGNPGRHVNGMFLAQNSPLGDVRLTATQAASMTRIGMFAKSNNVAGTGITIGGATNGAGDPLFGFNGLLPTQAGFGGTTFFEVLSRNGVAEVIPATAHGTYDVSWGIWSSGAKWATSAFDPLDFQLLNDPLVWMTVAPTNLGGLSGGRQYFHGGTWNGISNHGLNASPGVLFMNVNFDKSSFTGQLFIETITSSAYWQVYFDGTIGTQGLSITSYHDSFYHGNAGSGLSFNSQVQLVPTGAGADGLAVMFDFELPGNTNYFVQGNLVGRHDSRLTYAEAATDLVALVSMENFSAVQMRAAGVVVPAFVHSGVNLGMKNFYTKVQDVYRVGTATQTTPHAPYDIAGNAQYRVTWGHWNGSTALHWDVNNPTTFNTYAGNNSWMTVTPSPLAAINARTGVVTYGSVINSNVWSTEGAVTNVSATMNVNFDSLATAPGNLTFDAGASTWQLTSNIELDGQKLTPFYGGTALRNGTAAGYGGSASQGVLTGDQAQALAWTFRMIHSGFVSGGNILLCNNAGPVC